jgi:hypothetical protein
VIRPLRWKIHASPTLLDEDPCDPTQLDGMDATCISGRPQQPGQHRQPARHHQRERLFIYFLRGRSAAAAYDGREDRPPCILRSVEQGHHVHAPGGDPEHPLSADDSDWATPPTSLPACGDDAAYVLRNTAHDVSRCGVSAAATTRSAYWARTCAAQQHNSCLSRARGLTRPRHASAPLECTARPAGPLASELGLRLLNPSHNW